MFDRTARQNRPRAILPSPSEAFQTLASDYYKLPIRSEQFGLHQGDERTIQILTANAEYILIE